MSFGRTPHLSMMVYREWSCVGSKASHTPACTGRGLIPSMAMVTSPDDVPFIVRYEVKYSGLRLSLKVEIVMKTGTTSQSSAAHGRQIMEEGWHERFRVTRNSRVANSICTMMMHEYMVQSKPKLESCRLDSICIMMMHEYTVYMLIH